MRNWFSCCRFGVDSSLTRAFYILSRDGKNLPCKFLYVALKMQNWFARSKVVGGSYLTGARDFFICGVGTEKNFAENFYKQL